jgi:hypothetical protein
MTNLSKFSVVCSDLLEDRLQISHDGTLPTGCNHIRHKITPAVDMGSRQLDARPRKALATNRISNDGPLCF